jgi:hypothetical protein
MKKVRYKKIKLINKIGKKNQIKNKTKTIKQPFCRWLGEK